MGEKSTDENYQMMSSALGINLREIVTEKTGRLGKYIPKKLRKKKIKKINHSKEKVKKKTMVYGGDAENDYFQYISNFQSFVLSHTLLNSQCNIGHLENEYDVEINDRFSVSTNVEEESAIQDIRNSSLSYIQEGRIQIRLPSDHVRLICDPRLESGILCVEHSIESYTPHSCILEKVPQTLKSFKSMEEKLNEKLDPESVVRPYRPSLNYILTIDPDLYKRVFDEIAYSRYRCGLYSYFQQVNGEEGKLHISVAIGCMIVTIMVVFTVTLFYPVS